MCRQFPSLLLENDLCSFSRHLAVVAKARKQVRRNKLSTYYPVQCTCAGVVGVAWYVCVFRRRESET